MKTLGAMSCLVLAVERDTMICIRKHRSIASSEAMSTRERS